MEKINDNYACYMGGAKSGLIVLPTSKGVMLIPPQQIIRIQAISNYSKLFFNDGKSIVVAKVLRRFEEQTCLFSFIRIHRSHFVNMNYVKSYSGGKSGLLVMHNGEMFQVAKRKKASLTRRLNKPWDSLMDVPAEGPPFSDKKNLAA